MSGEPEMLDASAWPKPPPVPRETERIRDTFALREGRMTPSEFAAKYGVEATLARMPPEPWRHLFDQHADEAARVAATPHPPFSGFSVGFVGGEPRLSHHPFRIPPEHSTRRPVHPVFARLKRFLRSRFAWPS